MTETWHMGTNLRLLIDSYSMNTNKTGFRWLAKIVAFVWLRQK